jgi:hypothetical protein
MSPSITEARLAAWRAVSAEASYAPERLHPEDACADLYASLTVTSDGGLANPAGFSDTASYLTAWGLTRSEAGTIVVLDALAAIDAGVSSGDIVEIALKGATVQGPVEVGPLPVQVAPFGHGSAALVESSPAIASARAAYGLADAVLCRTRLGGTSAAVRIAALEAADAATGIGGSAVALAGIAATAWTGLGAFCLAATIGRRRATERLLVALGTRTAAARLVVIADVATVVTAGSLGAVFAITNLRQEILHMWTSPGSVQAWGVFAILMPAVLTVWLVVVAALRNND